MSPQNLILLALSGLVCSPLYALDVPVDIAYLYESNVDPSISDEFNAPTLDTAKWGYRTESASANWKSSNVTIENNGFDQYVNLLGESDRSPDASGVITGTGSSSGIYNRNQASYGFYTTRWRVEGISPDHKSIWHPAIWKAGVQPTTGWPSGGLPKDSIELDFVEFNQSRTLNIEWHSQAVAWDYLGGSEFDQQRFQNSDWSGDFADSFWNTHGLEYHPDYIQLWDFDEREDVWAKRGPEITISDAPTNMEAFNINRDLAHPGYWILSNYDFFDLLNNQWLPFHGRPINDTDNFLLSDSELQVDHFRYYPLFDGLKGDFNSDDKVDGLDFLLWQSDPNVGSVEDWGTGYNSAISSLSAISTNVPEPTGIALCLLALLFGGVMRERCQS
ncbi:MAG: hypothetical protein AAGD11_12030 [Planctomycetota bacterium]